VQLASTSMNKDPKQAKLALVCKGITQSKETLPFDM
jgi:hypothetical protein